MLRYKGLQSTVGATDAETMVIRNGSNDIELMERAHFSLAMRNVFEETKAVQTTLPVRMMRTVQCTCS